MTEASIPFARAFALGLLLISGCDLPFPEYNEIEDFRVLALRASPPAIREGESTTLDALVFVEKGSLDDVRYAWSWCPIREDNSNGGDCALNEKGFEAALGLPSGSLDFDLGEESTAELTVPGPAELYRAACENRAGAGDVRPFVLSCDGGFPLSVRADVTFGEMTIRAHKTVRFVYDAEVAPNQNPELGDLTFRDTDRNKATSWKGDEDAKIELGKSYELVVDVQEDTAERFIPPANEVTPNPSERRESLYITWFVSSGTTEFLRTTYLDDAVDIDLLGKNEWSLPKAKDEEEDEASLYLVLRDERGGVAWIERKSELAP